MSKNNKTLARSLSHSNTRSLRAGSVRNMTASRFRYGQDHYYTSRYNRCPVCDNTHGCKVFKDEKVWCLRVTKQSEVPEGWKLLGFLGDGMGASLIPQATYEERREEYARQQDYSGPQEKSTQNVTIEELDAGFRLMHKHIGLTTRDREYLLTERGLSPTQIEKGLYFSLSPQQELPPGIVKGFPGTDRWGRKLTNRYRGISQAIFTPEGLCTGMQIRNFSECAEAKYVWNSNRFHTARLDNGEFPITSVSPLEITGKYPGLCEGTGFKPQIAAEKLGVVMIGAAGGQHSSSPEQLRDYVKKACETMGVGDHLSVVIYPDAGFAVNNHVRTQTEKLIRLLQPWKVHVYIAWWGQVEKGSGDIDELDGEAITQIELIGVDEFRARSWKALIQKNEWERYVTGKMFTPDVVLDMKYFDMREPEEGEVMIVKSPMGSGKTEWLSRLLGTVYAETGVVGVAHRRSLLKGLQHRFGDRFYDLLEDEGRELVADEKSCLLLCYDSLHHFQPEDFNEKVIVLDEWCAGVRHALKGTTHIAFEREKKLFLLGEAIRRGKSVIAMDACMTDRAVQYIRELAGQYKKKITRVFNGYKGEEKRIEVLVHEKPAAFVEKCKEYEKVFIVTDSQKMAEKLDRMFQELGKVGLRIDSETHGIKDCPEKELVDEFLAAPDEALKKREYEYVVSSPVVENGLDVAVRGYFDAVFGFFYHLHTDALVQMLGRVRDEEVRRYAWCPEKGVGGRHGVVERSEERELYRRKYANEIELDCVIEQERAKGVSDEELGVLLLRLREKQGESLYESPHQKMLAFLDAETGYERDTMRACFLEALEREGYKVEMVVAEMSQEAVAVQKKLTDIGHEINEEVVKKTFEAGDITAEEASHIERLQEKTGEQSYKLKKYRVTSRLPGMKGTPLDSIEFYRHVLVKDRGYIAKAEKYFLLHHMEVAYRFLEKKWERVSVRMTAYPLEWVQEQQAVHSVLKAISECGLLKLIMAGQEISRESKEVGEIIEACRKKRISVMLGKRPPGKHSKNPMKFLGAVLKMVGMKLQGVRREGEGAGGKRVQWYRIVALQDEFWNAVQYIIGKKWEVYTEDTTEKEVRFSALRTWVREEPQVRTGYEEEGCQREGNSSIEEHDAHWQEKEVTKVLHSEEAGAEKERQEGEVIEWDDIIASIDTEMTRVGVGVPEMTKHLKVTYGVSSRLLLSDEQLFEFLGWLQNTPSLQQRQWWYKGVKVRIEKRMSSVMSLVRVIGGEESFEVPFRLLVEAV